MRAHLISPDLVEQLTPDPPAWDRRAILRQRWCELAYFHWPYEPAQVQRLLPRGVQVETFAGAAWVGLIPFEMRDVQLGRTPALPWLGSFVEVNVRTYVTDAAGRRAVWFFSLDVPRLAIVAVARSIFGLPYQWARADHTVNGERHRYRTARRSLRGPRPGADIRFRVGDPLADSEVGPLEHFLYARWALLTETRHRLAYARVDHPRWPLHEIDDVEIDENLIEAAGLPAPNGPPHARYSPGVQVKVAWHERTT